MSTEVEGSRAIISAMVANSELLEPMVLVTLRPIIGADGVGYYETETESPSSTDPQ